jgi:hypothetical protein
MKKLLLLAALTGSILASYGQGTVVFNNNASPAFNLWTNNAVRTASNLMSGASAYRIGLYAAPSSGAAEGSLTLVGLATNAPLAGKFNGGSAFVLPNGYAVSSPLTFQIRAWSFAGGLSYEEALTASLSNPLDIALGVSLLGTTAGGGTTPGGPVPAGSLFGTNPGQVGAFEIRPIPEPSSIALGLLGLGAIALFRRKK